MSFASVEDRAGRFVFELIPTRDGKVEVSVSGTRLDASGRPVHDYGHETCGSLDGALLAIGTIVGLAMDESGLRPPPEAGAKASNSGRVQELFGLGD